MTNSNNVFTVNRALITRMLIGAAIALAVILTFVLEMDSPNPEWHKTWWLRPVVITPLAGAGGGLFFHLMYVLGKQGSWKKILFSLIGIIGYVIALWLGTILGLAGTMWD